MGPNFKNRVTFKCVMYIYLRSEISVSQKRDAYWWIVLITGGYGGCIKSLCIGSYFYIAVIYVAVGVIAGVLLLITIIIVLCVLKMRKQSLQNNESVTFSKTSGKVRDKGNHVVNEAFTGEYEKPQPHMSPEANYSELSQTHSPVQPGLYEDIPDHDGYVSSNPDRSVDGYLQPIMQRRGHDLQHRAHTNTDEIPSDYLTNPDEITSDYLTNPDEIASDYLTNPDEIVSDYLTNPEQFK